MISVDGGPAFPVTPIRSGQIEPTELGMSLRDWFAGQVLPSVISVYVEANGRCLGTEHIAPNCAVHAYRIADAMLKARGEP